MALPRRTRLQPDQRRAQLLALGVDMLATRTLEQLSVEDLAEQAGISRGLLFHYFHTKADFHLQVVRAAADHLIERTRPDPVWAPSEALSRSLAAFVDYVSNNKQSYLALLRGAASSDAALRAVFDDTRAALTERVVASLVALGVPVDSVTRLAVRGWVAFVEETTVAWLAQGDLGDRIGRDELLALLTRALPALVLGTKELPAN